MTPQQIVADAMMKGGCVEVPGQYPDVRVFEWESKSRWVVGLHSTFCLSIADPNNKIEYETAELVPYVQAGWFD